MYTSQLTSGSITINRTDGITQLSVQANASSSCTILGSDSFQGNPSTPIELFNGESWTWTVPTSSPIDGITITWVNGSIDITMS